MKEEKQTETATPLLKVVEIRAIASPPVNDQMLSFFRKQTSSDRTSTYDQHLNERHSVTLEKH